MSKKQKSKQGFKPGEIMYVSVDSTPAMLSPGEAVVPAGIFSKELMENMLGSLNSPSPIMSQFAASAEQAASSLKTFQDKLDSMSFNGLKPKAPPKFGGHSFTYSIEDEFASYSKFVDKYLGIKGNKPLTMDPESSLWDE